jgi:hypothetical protein
VLGQFLEMAGQGSNHVAGLQGLFQELGADAARRADDEKIHTCPFRKKNIDPGHRIPFSVFSFRLED